MFYEIIKYLKESHLVSEIEILELVEEDIVKILKLKVKLKDNSHLFITEVHTIEHQKYSYHWQNESKKMLIRWDNSPHWKDIKTFPYHKHIGSKILPSGRVTVEEVLKEIENFLEKRVKDKKSETNRNKRRNIKDLKTNGKTKKD